MKIHFSWHKVEFNVLWKPYFRRLCHLFYSVIRCHFQQLNKVESACSLPCQGPVSVCGRLPCRSSTVQSAVTAFFPKTQEIWRANLGDDFKEQIP